MATRNIFNALTGALSLSLLLSISGCVGEDERDSAGSQDPDATTVVENRITGSVGDGPIVGARIRVRSSSGKVLMQTTSSGTADYDVTIKTKGKNYAVTVEADQGVDLVTGAPPDFRLVSAIMRPNERSISNLNPFTTLIFGAAKQSGGINDTSVAAARHAVVARYGFGLDKNLVPDPTSTPIDPSNVHIIVKTSETLGEMIRRTRDTLYASGANLDGDDVVTALAADLSDGWIDGRGAAGANAHVAAIANVASAAVLVESMANALHVYGSDATRAMDNAIVQVRPDAPASSSTDNVAISAGALAQAIRSLKAAQVVQSDPAIDATIELLARTVPGTRPADFAAGLPAGIDAVLNLAVSFAGTAIDSEIAAINAVARSTPTAASTDGTAGAPAISGTPDTALVVGRSWSFQPTASDPDGDTLSFSVQGQPGWTHFDTATGRLSGTPAAAGSFGPVTITASDGGLHTSLQAFTLQVAEPVVGSATVYWTAPTELTDGSPLTDLAGFRVYYGQNAGALDHVVTVNNVGQASQHVENLDGGTWYFAVTAFDADDLESAKSTIVSKTIM